ncbi:hypothetical protein FAGAP_10822 [Fusarium agapanthi]|uniref:Uncharacterized protein n=1 Tax=Fusarium agapanthi TaxID=1803897 RepID=A0A9P5E9E4_9HYPO|nr:hypothetical protein FAGAP_10822 [Fusarium agapanthi]
MTTGTDPSNESPWYEYLQSDLFWVLTILIISNGFWSESQRVLLSTKNEGQEDTQSSETPPKPASGINLKDHITSRFRQHLALLFFASQIPGELTHGLCVLKTLWRLSMSLVQSNYPVNIRPYLLGTIMFSPIAIPLLGAWFAVVSNPMRNLLFFQYVKRKFDDDEIWEGEGELASVTEVILAT